MASLCSYIALVLGSFLRWWRIRVLLRHDDARNDLARHLDVRVSPEPWHDDLGGWLHLGAVVAAIDVVADERCQLTDRACRQDALVALIRVWTYVPAGTLLEATALLNSRSSSVRMIQKKKHPRSSHNHIVCSLYVALSVASEHLKCYFVLGTSCSPRHSPVPRRWAGLASSSPRRNLDGMS